MRDLASLLADRITDVGVVAAASARPTLATDGVDISKWRTGSFGPRQAVLLLDGNQAITLATPAAGVGVELWGLVLGTWRLLRILNAGASIPIVDATHGWTAELADLAAATRLAIVGAPSAGAVSYSFVPLETWGAL